MRPSRSRLLSLITFLSWTSLLSAQEGDPETGGGAFLLVPVGARATALGQAGATVSGSSEAAFWNPAGLARMQQSEVGVIHASTFVSDNTALTSYFSAGGLGVLGVAAYLVDFGNQDVTNRSGVQTGRISPKNIELLASYAFEVAGPVSVGLNYKFIQFRQDCSGSCGLARSVVGSTHAVDVGVQVSDGPEGHLILGAVLRHAGFDLQVENRDQADPLPTRVQVGVAYRVDLPTIGPEQESADLEFVLDLQERWNRYSKPDARLGLEFDYARLLELRAGYAFLRSESSGPSLGMGLRLGSFVLDFARVFFIDDTFDEPTYLSLRALF